MISKKTTLIKDSATQDSLTEPTKASWAPVSEIQSISSFLSKSLRDFEDRFHTSQGKSIRLLVLWREGREHPWYVFLHGVSKSVWELERVEVIASPLQLVAGRQIHSIGGTQRAGESCYVRAGLLPLLLPRCEKKELRWKCVTVTFFSCVPGRTGN